MALATPITNGHLQAGAQVFAAGGASAPPPAEAGGSAADVQGTGDLLGRHNTPLHVAGLALTAGIVIFTLHALGFRIAFDVGLGRG